MTQKFNELIQKLKEIFQIDKPELDFGIYRILHARAGEINDFLEHRLADKVKEALAGNAAAEQTAMQKELDEAIAGAKTLGVPDPDALPKVKELKAKLAAMGGMEQAESEVYSHLLTFFSRYYDDGDFISKRRYKGDTYAIPYSGEEVKLHWANADQYYIKSGENFTNYDFTVEGKKVHFKLITAETAKDNIKDNEADRRFVLFQPEAAAVEDDEGREPLPAEIVEEKDGELFVYFQYLKVRKGTKQKDLMEAAEKKVMELLPKFQQFLFLATPAPTEKDKNRTLFRKHLEQYTAKNTSDYFIHKDLKGFLTRELDFYIKNEMMHLDDIQNVSSFKQIEMSLREIQAVRTIATELIAFMAQLEDFQKKLWLKKKFVTSCEYCITMDRVPENLKAEVLANEEQQDEWKRLGLPTGPLLPSSLLLLPSLDARMVDTKFFPESFKAKLLAAIPDLDGQCDGVLVHSENFGALKLLGDRYNGQIKCVYIDPPYNTGNDGFLYKDGYGHSSWMSLLDLRVSLSKALLAKGALYFGSADDNENCRLKAIFERAFGEDRFEAQIIVQSNKRGQTYQRIAKTHEYLLAFTADSYSVINELQKDGIKNESDNLGSYELWELRNRNPKFNRANRPNLYYPIYVLPDTVQDGLAKVTIDKTNGAIEVVPLNSEGEESCWRWGVEKLSEAITHGYDAVVAKQKRNGGWNIYEKSRKDSTKAKTIWDETGMISEQGTTALRDLGITEFAFPKPLALLEKIGKIATDKSSTVLDYFGGSGTTAHAVIALNREDGGHRKYILVEMGDHFDTVLKPRIEKVVYSPDWKDGKPTAPDKGISHCFKYLTLESYEDALNNIELEDKSGLFAGTMKDEFLLKYMLDIESRGSIINTENFRHPFDYELKIAVDSSGASEKRKVDLVETFNYLVGLTVLGEDRHIDKGYVFVEGKLPGDEKESLVVWRDCDKVDNAALNKLLETKGVKPGDSEYKTIFVNGDHAVPNKKLGADEGSPELKIRQLENVFLEKMFEVK